ncbi:MAG: phenylalanine--tRNA ligase subunit alpha [Bdellovibrionales bacterium]|nr:phenylalanine--tRNA ligase subunit alpha [Bdellovibrionales bacterium]
MIKDKLEQKLKEIKSVALKVIEEASSSEELYQVKVRFFGKQGEFTALMKQLGQFSKEERPQVGQLINQEKKALEEVYQVRFDLLQTSELNAKLEKESLDLTLPGPKLSQGSQHPIQFVMNEIVDILSRMGFSVRSGPLIESDWYNFEALNIPQNHPARDMQDTFYVNDEYVLRTHTSPIQIRTLENEEPPLRILAPGSVFRCDSDVTHSPNFYQIEGLLVDKKVSLADLKGTISFFVKEFLGDQIKTRFRPSYFPFTEPSAEVDCSCPICKGEGCRVCSHTGWIEIGGSGLVNPKVFEYTGLVKDEDPHKWQGYAFGFGIERMAMIKYGLNDIRMFNENDLRFLSQFNR